MVQGVRRQCNISVLLSNDVTNNKAIKVITGTITVSEATKEVCEVPKFL